MTDFQINDHILTKECDALAADIFAEVMAEPIEDVRLGNLSDCDPEDWRQDMYERAHEAADGHEWTIYNYKALMLCAHCNTTLGEDFLDDTGFEWTSDSTIYSVATAIVYGEIRARIERELQSLIDDWEPEEVAA